jgi:hypothetical protein
VHSLGYRFIGELQYTPPTGKDDADTPPGASLPRAPPPIANDEAGGARTPHRRRRLTDGDQFLNFIDLQPCLDQLANWTALLPPNDPQRRAILAVLSLEYARLRESGVATPALAYRDAVVAMLEGDRQAALAALSRAIDQGFRDDLALRRDLAWRVLADDADFHREQQRLDVLRLAERPPSDPPPSR